MTPTAQANPAPRGANPPDCVAIRNMLRIFHHADHYTESLQAAHTPYLLMGGRKMHEGRYVGRDVRADARAEREALDSMYLAAPLEPSPRAGRAARLAARLNRDRRAKRGATK